MLHIIKDAEERGSSRPEVAALLKDLKTAAYEDNRVFDEFKYEALQREAKKKGHHNKSRRRTYNLKQRDYIGTSTKQMDKTVYLAYKNAIRPE